MAESHPYLEDLPGLVLGALDAAEASRLEAHLDGGCQTCRTELSRLIENAAELPPLVPLRPLPPKIKDRLMRSIQRDAPAPRAARSWQPLATAAALLLALVTGFLYAGLLRDVRTAEALRLRLEAERDEARLQRERLAAQLQSQETELAWIKDPRVQVALLRGLAGAPGGKAKLLWHPQTHRGLLYAAGLPPLPLEKSYELWVFVGSVPKPAGVFEPGPDGSSLLALDSVESLGEGPVKFAVSVEPKGGRSAPTGAVVLLGETF